MYMCFAQEMACNDDASRNRSSRSGHLPGSGCWRFYLAFSLTDWGSFLFPNAFRSLCFVLSVLEQQFVHTDQCSQHSS